MGKTQRRKAPRRDYHGHLGLLHLGTFTEGRCEQIGEGGALIAPHVNNQNFTEGETLVVTLFFPDIGGIVSTAKCLYKKDSGAIGLSFINLPARFKKRVRDYVSRR